MSARAQQVLSRFPAHLEAAQPGKQLGRIAEAPSGELDDLSVALGLVRRAHRLAHVDTRRDLTLMAGLHGLSGDDFAFLDRRTERLRELLTALAAGADIASRTAVAEQVFELFGVAGAPPRLALFAPAGDAQLALAAAALEAAVAPSLRYGGVLEAARRRLALICSVQVRGNGTLRALLELAANALDLDLDLAANRAAELGPEATATTRFNREDALVHSTDSFWHASFVREREPLVREVPSTPPAKLVTVPGPVPAIRVTTQLGLSADAALTALRELDVPITRLDQQLAVADAERLAKKFGYELELVNKGRVEMGSSVSVGELAASTLLPVRVVIARLLALGLTGVTAQTLLGAETAAAAVRKYGFVVRQSLALAPSADVLGIEENPIVARSFDAGDLAHAQLFSIQRRGFGRELLEIHVDSSLKAGGSKTLIGPLLVNRDEGRGVGFAGTLAPGEKLVFAEDGRVQLADGTDVTERAYSFHGACFADAAELDAEQDFVFDGVGAAPKRPARFVVSEPAAALDREMTFPHAGAPVRPPGIGIGKTRFAFFVQQATFSAAASGPARSVTPRYAIGFADGSLFAPPPGSETPAAHVSLHWREHEGFALRVLIPKRFSGLDGGEFDTRKSVRRALERVRPAGIDVRVEYYDPSWTLGAGALPSGAVRDPVAALRSSTLLAPAPAGG